MLRRLLPFIPLLFFIACVPMDNVNLQAAIQTLTATVWTPTPSTPSATPVPKTGQVVDELNLAFSRLDPLASTIGAKFSVIDVRVMTEPPNNVSAVLRIDVECEWVYSDSCTVEESFIRLMHSLRTDEEVGKTISENVPTTIHTLQMASFNRMTPEGMIVARWQDVLDYMSETINGNQLGARIVRMAVP